MAYPTDPRNPASANASAFVSARLTPEEAERLAATFRPSWEPDEAPFVGPATMSDADLRALRGGGTHPDVRGSIQAINGARAPVPATVLHEPESSVIIDPAIAAPEQTPLTSVPSTMQTTQVIPRRADPRIGTGASAREAPTVTFPAARSRMVSLDEVEFRKRSKTGLWLGLGAAAVILISVGIWLASGSDEKQAPLPFPPAQKTQATVESRVPPPPRLPETAAPQPIAPAPPPPAAIAPVAAAPPPAVAPPAPPPRLVVPPAPRPPSWVPPQARPAARPKPAGTTIVRDVPF
jgi:hypothetical protein